MPNPNLKRAYLPLTRLHVRSGSRWGQEAGTDYWLNFNSGFDILGAAATATGEELAENGWVSTSMINTAGSGADAGGGLFTKVGAPGPQPGRFPGTYGDAGTPNHALTNATGDLLVSPAIFGDAVHREQAAVLAGMTTLPRFLIADFWAAMTVASANEVRSSFGFYEDGATDTTVEADQYAVVQSNGTNFLLAGNAATMATGALVGTGWSKWRIVLQFNGASGPNVYAYRDGVIFSTTPGVGASDEFPLRFGTGALTTNRPALGASHIYYEWGS